MLAEESDARFRASVNKRHMAVVSWLCDGADRRVRAPSEEILWHELPNEMREGECYGRSKDEGGARGVSGISVIPQPLISRPTVDSESTTSLK